MHDCAARGDRQERHTNNFKSQMRMWAGPECNNEVKDAESGGYTFYQHGFGSLVDSLKRELATPFSRCCKGEDKLIDFLKDSNKHLTVVEAQSIRSTLNCLLAKAPELKALVLSRLDWIVGETTRRFGTKIPKAYQPSTAMPGESEEEGDAMLRCALKTVWSFMTIDNGKYLRRSYVQCLEPTYQTVHMKPQDIADFESDASGDGNAMFDPKTGIYIQEWYTTEELEALFDYERDDKGIIISNAEGMPPARMMPLLLAFHDSVVRVARNRNDNQNMCAAVTSKTAAKSRV